MHKVLVLIKEDLCGPSIDACACEKIWHNKLNEDENEHEVKFINDLDRIEEDWYANKHTSIYLVGFYTPIVTFGEIKNLASHCRSVTILHNDITILSDMEKLNEEVFNFTYVVSDIATLSAIVYRYLFTSSNKKEFRDDLPLFLKEMLLAYESIRNLPNEVDLDIAHLFTTVSQITDRRSLMRIWLDPFHGEEIYKNDRSSFIEKGKSFYAFQQSKIKWFLSTQLCIENPCRDDESTLFNLPKEYEFAFFNHININGFENPSLFSYVGNRMEIHTYNILGRENTPYVKTTTHPLQLK